MGSPALTLSVSETIVALMRATGNYVYHKISTEEGKAAYKSSLKECIEYASSGLTNLDLLRTKIEGHRNEAFHLYTKSFFNKRLDEYRCHEMAVDQALDIVTSLEKRFILGQSDDAPRNYKGKGYIYEDQSIF